MNSSKRRIASLALFRSLYNEGRTDVMTILCEFAKTIVYSKHLTGITPTQIKKELKTEYDFYIPEYVVESVLKKFCKKENSKYYPEAVNQPQEVNSDVIDGIERSHENIISQLLSYVEDKVSKELNEDERERLFQSFYNYLLDEPDDAYAEYISSFLIETQKDSELFKQLRIIKEGVILYTGIQYNDNVSETGSWKDDFTIFVEQEILFHFAGYNGSLYQQLFLEFFELVKEINRKARKQLIRIRYFDAVRYKIESFFNAAEDIVEGKATLDCSSIAMTTIVQGCETKADVVAKKCGFFDFLKKNSISEVDGGKNIIENNKYNIFFEDNLKGLSESLSERDNDDIEWSLKLLNYISLIRRGSISGFEKSKCILLTGNYTTMAVAHSPIIKMNGDVPLATTLDYFTNRLWFKLNKGFGTSSCPKSFDIVTKAQIVLSAQIAGSVAIEFEKIKKEIIEKKKPESVIIAELAELKTKVRKPEEVSESNIAETLQTIKMVDTERYLREREMERIEAEKQKEDNERLQQEVNRKRQEKDELEFSKNSEIQQKEHENVVLSNLLNETRANVKNKIQEQIDAISRRKDKADIKVQKRVKILRWFPFAIIFLVVIIVGLLTRCYGWDKMEPLTWFLAVLVAMIPYFVFGLGFNGWNPKNVIDVWYKNKYEKKLYEEYDIDIIKYQQLKDEYNSLR